MIQDMAIFYNGLHSESVNSFAMCQHLFDMAAKPIDVDSIFSRILFPCSCINFAQNVIIQSVRGSD